MTATYSHLLMEEAREAITVRHKTADNKTFSIKEFKLFNVIVLINLVTLWF